MNRLVSTTESGITRRGNCILRTILSLLTTEPTARVVASEKSAKSVKLRSKTWA